MSGDASSQPTALVILAEGAEEIETVVIVDVLRRGGVTVTLAGLDADESQAVLCSRNVRILPDCSLAKATNQDQIYDAIILPGGGKGAENLRNSLVVGTLLKDQESSDRIIGAVCAAPTALLQHGIAKGKKITSYPAFKDQLVKDYEYVEEAVVVDGKIVTSRGPGTCFKFGVTLVEQIAGPDKAAPLGQQMLL
ncbi:hypothetical protein TCAL_07947 [Tigriopus californicus]|uniref:DJ-1/PfpI domain-containing protein n=1 Tax=Tigriopus californicus TaxID=6832 RepID=A0A553NB94_TIGCA|nr:protein dj-1beta-like [Tigriopus californicus]XP_059094640.1 protein dj-1beta-like [Tigriopus californicus]TRY62649.1 hypothetical protein TCAL_07947 [Tigriopus californicus]|eukprot:TCALIF_07947-PA protein Name:"Similar to park7 Protein DJ-1 (Danio rerio)" AED:0.18 eAED:0.18 QI:10/1/1/1/1/1/3/180/193